VSTKDGDDTLTAAQIVHAVQARLREVLPPTTMVMGRGGGASEGGEATEEPGVTGVCTCAFTSPHVAPATHTHPNPTRRPPTPHPPRTHGQAQEAASRGDQPRDLLDCGHEDMFSDLSMAKIDALRTADLKISAVMAPLGSEPRVRTPPWTRMAPGE